MSLRSGSQIRLGEWKSRSTQVGSASIADLQAPRSTARHSRRATSSVDRDAEPRQIPVEQQLDLDQIGVDVVGRQRVHDMRRDRYRVGQLLAVQRDQHVDRRRIALLDRRRRIAGHHRFGAEVLDDQQAVGQLGLVDLRRREAALAQPVRHRDERARCPRRDARWRCRACRRAPAGRPAGAASSSGWRAARRAAAARRSASRRRPGCAAARPCRSRWNRGSGGPPGCARRAPRRRRSR